MAKDNRMSNSIRVRKSETASTPGFDMTASSPCTPTPVRTSSPPGWPLGGAWPLGSAWPLGNAWPLGWSLGSAWPLGGPGFPATPPGDDDPDVMEVSLGWIPDIPDGRDYPLSDKRVRAALAKLRTTHRGGPLMLRAAGARAGGLPRSVDLSAGGDMGPVENQGRTNSCTANAVIGAVEYLYFKGCGQRLDLSRLFLYRTTRKLLGFTGDRGAYLRSTIQALATFGAPPEYYWPFNPAILDLEPDAFVYQMASNFKALVYARLDENGSDGEATLGRFRAALADGFPVALGFPVYSSIRRDGTIPYPVPGDRLEGGHAVLAVGYDEKTRMIKIRNSWGPEWGKDGYGYLPYRYVTEQLALDCWVVFSESWIENGVFGQ